MPELPEAETIVRGIRDRVTGTRITRTRVHHDDLLDMPPGRFARTLKNRVILGVSRRGKNVVIEADGPTYVVVNLGMTGGLFPLAPRERNPGVTHPGVRFQLGPAGQLVYNDARRFGRLRLLDADGFAAWSATLGPEPLGPDFTAARLADDLPRSRSPLRSWLLDQRRVAGVGNIYANEALYRAGLDPRRRAHTVSAAEAWVLRDAVVEVLAEAIRARGTTIRDYRDAGGAGGSFGPRLRVYGRADQPCSACGTRIQRVVFGNRSAFLCATCQPPDESDAPAPT
jgi:formamidopyrimidine-DNA glycosylase